MTLWKLNHVTWLLANNQYVGFNSCRGQRKNLGYVIDRMGEASSRAQGLREIITSTQRLQISELHRVYLMKDPQANGGKGSVVGLLKVGEKNLFVYDAQGRNHEMKPTCVLDFFVNEKIQRRGYGKSARFELSAQPFVLLSISHTVSIAVAT